ncbi:MAG: 3-hydroxyacyl-ACP dehydratase FabZ [Bdellovibrionota bacterium]
MYDVNDIAKILPHRYPFLLIDKVLSKNENNEIVAIKNVTINEPFFQGHFPGKPVMPGVLVIEAMAQAGAFLARIVKDTDLSKTFYLVGVDDFKWRKQVVPGDVIYITMKLLNKKSFLWKMRATATVDGEIVASGILTAAEK